ncbi:MAG: TfuA-like protein [Hyphomicrobiaceae bacterium]
MRRAIEAAIFVGPSLRREDLVDLPKSIEVLGPATQGDIYRISQFRPRAIGLIDGFYHSIPAPWHKEILWALSCGIAVYGAGSLGALRAAELAHFGMHGVGEIFQLFASGDLTDDDEVAIAHGPEEIGYPAVSEAMVNLRFTLRHALTSGKINAPFHDTLIGLAKSRPFWKRSLQSLFDDAKTAGCPISDTTATWIRANTIDQKRRDAVELVTAVQKELTLKARSSFPAQDVPFEFQATTMWQSVCEDHLALDETPVVGVRELILEIALKGEGFARSVGIFPVSVPQISVPDAKSMIMSKPGPEPELSSPSTQNHDAWMRKLVGKLKASGKYDELLEAALARRKAMVSNGAVLSVSDPEATLSSHFEKTRETVPWFRKRTATCWKKNDSFWSAFEDYAQNLGLRNSGEFVRAVVADRQQSEITNFNEA